MAEEPEQQELAAYAFDLLDRPRRARLEAHLRDCAPCAQELADYRQVMSALPHALSTARAPSEAWNVIAARVRQRGEIARPARPSARWWPGRWSGMPHVSTPALAVALAVAVIGLVGWNASLQVQLARRDTGIPALAGAPHELVMGLVGAGPAEAAEGYLIMSQDRRQGGLVVAGLPALAEGRSYQIWFVRPDQSRTASDTFRVDRLGQAVMVMAVPQPGSEYYGVTVTEEPVGGSATPTGRDLLAGPIYEQ